MTCLTLFADDRKLIGIVKNIKDRENLQEDIDSVVNWSDECLMTFNTKKCQFMDIND